MQGPQLKNSIPLLDLHLDQLLFAQLIGGGTKVKFRGGSFYGC